MRFFGPNDSFVAMATNSNTIKVHEISTWSCQMLQGHDDTVLSLDVHCNGYLLASASKVSLKTSNIFKIATKANVLTNLV